MSARISSALICLGVVISISIGAISIVGTTFVFDSNAVLQIQTKCANPKNVPHSLTLSPDDKFCSECGERTEYGKYSDSLEVASAAEQRNNHRGAANAFLEAAIRRVSDVRKAAALTGAGRNLLELGERPDALKELEKAKRLDPKSPETTMLLGRVEFENRNLDKAEALFTEANSLAKKPSFAAMWLGEIAFERKNMREAQKQYALAEPENVQSYRLALHFGYALRSLDNFDGAIERFERAKTLEPLSFEPVLELAELYTLQRKLAKAAEMWGRAGDLKPSSSDYPLKQAAMYVQLEDYDKAYTAFRVAIGRDPNNYECLIGLASIEVLKNNLTDADLHLAAARKIRSDNLQAEFLHGLVRDLRDQRKETMLVTHDARDRAPSWHPGGMKIAFQTTRDKLNQIYVMPLGEAPFRVSTAGQCGDPAWSPDGKLIAFHSDRKKNADIYVVDPQTKRETQLTTDKEDDESACWSPDGKQIAFMSKRGPGKSFGIYVMDADGSNVKPLAVSNKNNEMPKFSPDGSKILFTSDRSGKRKLWVMNADGTGPRMMDNGADEEDFGCWSPDGKRIAFSIEKKNEWSVWVMNADGSGAKRLNEATKESELEPAWNPNGIRIMTSVIIKVKAAGSTDAYGTPISGGFKENYEIKNQLAPRL